MPVTADGPKEQWEKKDAGPGLVRQRPGVTRRIGACIKMKSVHVRVSVGKEATRGIGACIK